jgi:hypothetical protein
VRVEVVKGVVSRGVVVERREHVEVVNVTIAFGALLAAVVGREVVDRVDEVAVVGLVRVVAHPRPGARNHEVFLVLPDIGEGFVFVAELFFGRQIVEVGPHVQVVRGGVIERRGNVYVVNLDLGLGRRVVYVTVEGRELREFVFVASWVSRGHRLGRRTVHRLTHRRNRPLGGVTSES